MQFGVVEPATGRVVGRSRARTLAEEGVGRVIDRMAEGVREACRGAGVGLGEVAAVGIGAPAPIDHERGVVTHAPNLRWRNVALADELAARLRGDGGAAVRIHVDNDVNAAAYGEYCFGAGRGTGGAGGGGDMMAVWIGTGVGGGLILRGEVYQGAFFTGGELGQVILLPREQEGERSVESRCARRAIARRIAAVTGESVGKLGAEEIARRCAKRDGIASGAVDEAMDLLGVAVANMVTVLGLPRVVVGGGLTELMGEALVGRVRESVLRNVFYEQCRGVEVVMTGLGADAGVVGAAMLAVGKREA